MVTSSTMGTSMRTVSALLCRLKGMVPIRSEPPNKLEFLRRRRRFQACVMVIPSSKYSTLGELLARPCPLCAISGHTGPRDFSNGPLFEPIKLEAIRVPAKAQHARTPANDMTIRLFPFVGSVLDRLAEGRCDLAHKTLRVAIEGDLRAVSSSRVHLRFVTVARIVSLRRDFEQFLGTLR